MTTTEKLPTWIIPTDIIKIGLDMFTLVAALFFLFTIIFDKLYKTVPMLLITNSCVAELLIAIYILAQNILVFYHDIHQVYSYNWFCLIIPCLGSGSIIMQNYSYLLQTMHRYILIVHPTRLLYQSMKFQILPILILWACCIIYPVSLILTGQIKYLPDEATCQMPLEPSFIAILNLSFIYFIPMSSIVIVYLKMLCYVHQMSKRTIPANRLVRAKRQLTIIRRIVGLVSILVMLGFPYAIFITMSFFNRAPKYHFRIAFIFTSISMVLVIIALFQISEPLKASIMKRIRIRQVNAVNPIP